MKQHECKKTLLLIIVLHVDGSNLNRRMNPISYTKKMNMLVKIAENTWVFNIATS